MTLAQGQLLQTRYRVVSLLGQGGFGAVYKGWDLSLNRPVAIKENLDTSPEAQRQFQHEAQILSNISHPNLPRVQDHFLLPGMGQYLVMDYIEGEDLQEVLNRQGQPLTEEQAVAWLIQVCDALAYLHTQTPPIIHRDIKPANIKITPQGKAVLVDFGISKVYDPQLKTTVGARAVTPGYSPVEQYGQGITDVRTDIYAFGATLYMLLTGHEPQESVQRTLEDKLQAPQQINPRVKPVVGQVVQRALALSPTGRYQSAQDLQRALIDAAQQAKQERIDTLYRQAGAAIARNDFVTAESNLRQMLAIEPNHAAALALLNQVVQQRDAGRRYQDLVATVAQVKAEALVLQQINPPLADPNGVLCLFDAPLSNSQASHVPPNPVDAPSPFIRTGRQFAILGLISAATVGGLGLTIANNALHAVLNTSASHDLSAGNLLFGLGLGLQLGVPLLLNVLTMRAKSVNLILSVLLAAGLTAFAIGLRAAGPAIAQVDRTLASQNLGLGNFLMGLGVSIGLNSVVWWWLASREPVK